MSDPSANVIQMPTFTDASGNPIQLPSFFDSSANQQPPSLTSFIFKELLLSVGIFVGAYSATSVFFTLNELGVSPMFIYALSVVAFFGGVILFPILSIAMCYALYSNPGSVNFDAVNSELGKQFMIFAGVVGLLAVVIGSLYVAGGGKESDLEGELTNL